MVPKPSSGPNDAYRPLRNPTPIARIAGDVIGIGDPAARLKR
jgi:hypothetical protein